MRLWAVALTAVSVLVCCQAAAPESPPSPAAAPAVNTPSPSTIVCTYNNMKYSRGSVICVGPHFGQQCSKDDDGKDGKWSDLSSGAPYNQACASRPNANSGANTSSLPVPPFTCSYHDIKYSPGALICVGPSFGQKCTKADDNNGKWDDPRHEGACVNAPIPAPTAPPPAPAAKS
jgi:hypothetical protein